MKNQIKLFILFGIILFGITSCDPAKHLARFVKRHPELVKSDTIWKVDTIQIPGAAKDSTFHFYQHDTVVMRKDNLTVKYYLNHDSTVYLSGQCDPKIIYKPYPVVINKVEVQELSWWERNRWWVIGGGVLLLILYVILRIYRIKI